MSQEETLSASAQADLDRRTAMDRKVSLDWSRPTTWVLYAFGVLGLVLLAFLVFGFIFIRVIPEFF